jgi:hypothetical protein
MADPERIWLEPPPGDPDGRLWCKDDVWTGDPAYAQDGPPTEYVRADLHEQVIAAMGDAMGAATERFAEIMRLQGEAAALRAKLRALSGPLPSDPDGRMWSTLNYFANREDDDLDTEVMGWAMSAITGLRTRVAELEAALGTILVLIAGSPEQIPDWATARDIRDRARRALEPADGR